jgi:hypothetical protein
MAMDHHCGSPFWILIFAAPGDDESASTMTTAEGGEAGAFNAKTCTHAQRAATALPHKAWCVRVLYALGRERRAPRPNPVECVSIQEIPEWLSPHLPSNKRKVFRS